MRRLAGRGSARNCWSWRQAFAGLIHRYQNEGVTVAVARLESVRARAAFERFGLIDLLGADHFFHSVDQAVHHCCGTRSVIALTKPGAPVIRA